MTLVSTRDPARFLLNLGIAARHSSSRPQFVQGCTVQVTKFVDIEKQSCWMLEEVRGGDYSRVFPLTAETVGTDLDSAWKMWRRRLPVCSSRAPRIRGPD